MMEYKRYAASMEFDDSADVLHGRVANSGPYPIATFEAIDARELRREFERSVDQYLQWCEEDGVEPRKPFPGELNDRLDSELRAARSPASSGIGHGTRDRLWHRGTPECGRSHAVS